MVKKKEKGYIYIKMVVNMKDILEMIKKKEKEYFIMQMEIDIKEIF